MTVPALLAASLAAASDIETKVFLSRVYTIAKPYKSMEGPLDHKSVSLSEGKPEMLWIRGFRTAIVGEDGSSPASPEFMCHVNLDVDMARHQKLFGWKKYATDRLLTLSQGQFDISLPEGFGIPLLSNEPLTLATQVLNHNRPAGRYRVRQKVTVDFVRDSRLKAPLRPLFMSSAFVMALMEGKDGYFGAPGPTPETEKSSCLPGRHAAKTALGTYQDPFGRKMTGHWVVPPGREVRRTAVASQLNIPFDTTIHYIAVHLHPFAQSLELRDLATGRSLFKTRARQIAGGIGLEEVETYSSTAGIPIHAGRGYELISVYNNTTTRDQDSMASLFLYLLDKEFSPPAPE